MKKGPLEGIKVLDFSQVLSAPFCGMMLADMGAEVIKIERPGLGDISREYGPYANDISLYFCQYNRGKKGIAIDMRSEEGKKVVLDLVAQVDVVIENFKAGTLEKLGIGYDKMLEVNPGLIYGSISGFGTYGPLSHLPCMDIIAAIDILFTAVDHIFLRDQKAFQKFSSAGDPLCAPLIGQPNHLVVLLLRLINISA